MNNIFNNNIFWLLVGIAIGSSYVMGTQFVKAWVEKNYFKKGPHHTALDEANAITMQEMMVEEMEKTRNVAKDHGTITIPAKNLPRYAVCSGCGEYERVDYWYGGIVPYCRDCCKGIIN